MPISDLRSPTSFFMSTIHYSSGLEVILFNPLLRELDAVYKAPHWNHPADPRQNTFGPADTVITFSHN